MLLSKEKWVVYFSAIYLANNGKAPDFIYSTQTRLLCRQSG